MKTNQKLEVDKRKMYAVTSKNTLISSPNTNLIDSARQTLKSRDSKIINTKIVIVFAALINI